MSQLTLYGTERCPRCQTLKHTLDDLKAEYTYVDVMKDSQAADRLVELGFEALPVLSKNGEYFANPNIYTLKGILKED